MAVDRKKKKVKKRKGINANDMYQKTYRYKKGKSFEQKVGDIFKLMGFNVEYNRVFSGYEIDVFIKKKKSFGEKYEYYIIECKDWEEKVGREVVDKAFAAREAVKNDPECLSLSNDCEVMIISNKEFTDSAVKAASAHRIILHTYDRLQKRLMNFDYYLSKLIKTFESSPLYKLYIQQDFHQEYKPEIINSFKFVEEWLQDPNRKQLSLLGDYGAGKTSFAEALTYKMAIEYKNAPEKSRIPFLINLKEYKGVFRFKSLLQQHLERAKVNPIDEETFLSLLADGHVLLIFDAFDEMAAMNSPDDTLNNFEELNKAVRGDAKVILISRTHYFRDKDEVERILKKQGIGDMSDFASMLFRKISNRPGYEIVYLKEFSDPQIQEYLQKSMGEKWETAYQKIKSIYNLHDLSSRPVLLDMIAKTLPIIREEEKKFNLTHLYEAYTQYWLERDYPQLQITRELKQELVEGLAYRLWNEGKISIHYSALSDMISEHLKGEFKPDRDLEITVNLVRTASFLVRDKDDNYSFAHRSFHEFFIARKIKKELLKENFDILNLKLLSGEIVFFLRHLMGDDESTIRKVSGLLKEEYRDQISENALFVFYMILRMVFLKQQFSLKEDIGFSHRDVGAFKNLIQTHLPTKFELQGALLNGWTLPYMVYNNANFTRTKVEDSVFNGTSFKGILFSETHMKGTDFNGSNFKNVRFDQVTAHHCNFKNCRFENCTIEGSDFSLSNFMDTAFESCIIKDNDFTGAGFYHSNLDIKTYKDNVYLGTGVPEVDTMRLSPVFVDQGHKDIIRTVAISKDGRFMVSGSDDKTVKVWDLESGHLIKTLEGHVHYVLSVFISPDNRWIASGSSDHTVKLWDLENGHLITTFQGHKDWVNSVFISPDDRMIVSGSSDQTVKLWDLDSGQLIKTLEAHNHAVLSVFVSPNTRRIVSGGDDKTVKVWDLGNGCLIKTMKCHENNVWSIFITPDNRSIVSSGDDKMVKLWDLENGHLIRTLEGHEDWVRSVFVSPNNRWMVSGSDDKTVRLWDLKNGHLVRTFEGHEGIVNSVFINHDNRLIVSGSFDETIKVWKLESGQLIRTLENHKDPVNSDITNQENLHRLYYRDRLALYPASELSDLVRSKSREGGM
ncbi:MAG: NACHT domain-containing protein [Candidatus Aminicenantes bacterium]|nr:NACHT domain-containing protein [Candidatus Aminicenantes bacterium]NIM82382.1 NACHT domain-containing protein [Candidatus Aminicenantes bacterium]NIN21772.1 NACHT domain-containing protein [Candidatus Aminicenantes bacterium]NIN42569.1 NACHT domain-containing protein [Candidatus Aminicenantes bacterium]NIN85335.1 NACHT domain-containing protein [Candidatus Aminicenantes bacterium]